MYDLIGDIHGQADELEALLKLLGYSRVNDVYCHESRKVIFLGDFIDRGPHQRRTLNLVRAMIDRGTALAVMGNHEFNAILYYTPGSNGEHLRKRNEDNRKHHQAFLNEFENDTHEWGETIEWFNTLPLWLDLDGLRVIHACWDRSFVERILDSQGGSNLMGSEFLHASVEQSTWQNEAAETLLKGKAIQLPDGIHYNDLDGIRRHKIRVRWWDYADNYRQAFVGPESYLTNIPDDPIEGDHMVEYGHAEKPLFLGHYWFDGNPSPLAPNIACLDYSVAKPGGKLVAYRWDGEASIDVSKFMWVDRIN